MRLGRTVVLSVLVFFVVFMSRCSWQRDTAPPTPYELELWDYRQPLVGQEFAYQEYLLRGLEEFTLAHPHISVKVRMLNWVDGHSEVERVLSEGRPPDIYRSLDAAQMSYHPRLYPAGAEKSDDDCWVAAVSAVSSDGGQWGWPSWLGSELWLINLAWYEDSDAEMWAKWQRNGYSWQQLSDRLATQGGSIDWVSSRIWSLYQHPYWLYVDRMLEVAAQLYQLKQAGAVVDPALAGQQHLDDFYRGTTPMVAPVNPYLARYLSDRIGTRSEPTGRVPTSSDLLWLPPPALGSQAEFPWQVSSYHVFLIEDDEQRAQWAAQLAEYLAEYTGRWGAEQLGMIPARCVDLTSWSLSSAAPLPLRTAMIKDLSREGIPLRSPEQLAEAESVWHKTVLPAMLTMLSNSPLPDEELSQRLAEHLAVLTPEAPAEEEEEP